MSVFEVIRKAEQVISCWTGKTVQKGGGFVREYDDLGLPEARSALTALIDAAERVLCHQENAIPSEWDDLENALRRVKGERTA